MIYNPSSMDKQYDFTEPVLVIAIHTARFLYLRQQKYIPNKPQLKQAVTGTQPLYHINNTLNTSTPANDRISIVSWYFVAVELHFMA